ncbi:beta family protein [Salinivibrio kushneri]|uniref:beta family protein n=1 Tax=Salinivibrio kushneri TaxID=1908198 RepID=UPI0022B31FBF|nr:beta family protein [Salinivibrio kushneri]WBA12405.1 beta family protein [Salinivibrio kushneri]
MSEFFYFPIIKTRDGELRCFENINDDDFSKILPIYELTKSRKTKKAPDGDIYRRMKQIAEIQKKRPFILDLSTNEKYMNPQIEQLLSEHNGFKEWQYFLFDLHCDLNIIPMVHLYEDDDGKFEDVEEFVRSASTRTNYLAVRLPYDLSNEEIKYYLTPITSNLNENCKLYVILDAEFVRKKAISDVVDTFLEACSGTESFVDKIEDVVMLCSSFPSNVAQTGGEDIAGEFRIYEEDIYQGISEEFPIKYGDYVSINTEQIEMKGGTFVPRVDIASLDGKSFTYKRYRRNNGGYVRAAEHTVRDTTSYKPLGVWADEEIQAAANDNPSGISPAFWISVRMNYYIKSRILLRESDDSSF